MNDWDEKENKLKTSIFFVEANSFEQFELWREHHEEVDWEEDHMGFWQMIGNIAEDKPVCVTFQFAKIYGKRICFYYSSGRYNDSIMVEEFIENNYPVKWDSGSRRAMCDAMNFHHAMDACRTANLKQWERKKKLDKINELYE